MNKYHIYEEEGKGKYSVIFKARIKKKLEFVAIKRMDRARKGKILNESRILSDLHHPNIIKFQDHMETKNHMWAVTQYCPGGDLLKIVEQDKSLPEGVVRGFGLEIMKGLAASHRKGVVVCDLKLATVLLNEYGKVKLGDFGSAQQLSELMNSHRQHKKGTPCYMAPELFEVGSVYSFASDLWALGCMLYELAMGSPPFVSSSLTDIAALTKTAPTPRVDFFSSDFNHLLEQLLQKSPQKRAVWADVGSHSWVRGQVNPGDMPKQPHFDDYLARSHQAQGVQMLRASQQFEGYGQGGPVPAHDRRQQFVFEADEEHPPNEFEDSEAQAEAEYLGAQDGIQAQSGGQTGRRPRMASEIEDSATINIFMETLSSRNLPSIDEVLQHQSDSSVKPIIGNKDIESVETSHFNKKALGFPYIDPKELAQGVLNGQMETQLKRILDGMVGEEKLNVLGYFQSIIQDSDIANYLFKSNFIPYYLKLLKGYKQAALRSKICEILGLLIRHATAIDPDILKYGIINGLLDSVKDKSEKVRRKAMAALGELLFYGATQVDEKVNEWDLSINLIHSLLKLLKNPQEDELVRLYCCKSIENITAQAKQVGLKFAQIDTLLVLVNSFNGTKHQGFRTSIAATLHHIIQLNPTLREMFLDKVGVQNMIQTFRNPQTSPKTNQILLWAILSHFEKSPKSKMSRSLMDDGALIGAVLGLLELNSSVVRGRVYLFIYFLLYHNLRRSVLLLESRIFQLIERQGKDGAKYETQCLQFVLVVLYQGFQTLLRLVEEDIRRAIKPTSSQAAPRKHFFIGVVAHMVSSPIFEEIFEKYHNIQMLVALMGLFEASNSQENGLGQIKSQYIQVVERILSNNSLSEKLQQSYTSHLVPLLVGKVLKSTQNDIRFCCTKYLVYLVNAYMSEENLYDSGILPGTSHKLTQIISQHLLPQLDYLLAPQTQQAVASITLKLVAVLFQASPLFIEKFLGSCNLESVTRYYHPHSSIHVLKAVQLLARSPKLTPQQQETLIAPTATILNHYLTSHQQIYLEYPIDVLTSLATLCDQENLNRLWPTALSLQAHDDIVIRQKAEALVAALLTSPHRPPSNSKWEIRSKKAQSNYQEYISITGEQADPKLLQAFKKAPSRYQ